VISNPLKELPKILQQFKGPRTSTDSLQKDEETLDIIPTLLTMISFGRNVFANILTDVKSA
jgi:hypothetical protein